jgi:cytochrome c peroxidase
MKMKLNIFKTTFTLGLTSLLVVACQKDNATQSADNQQETANELTASSRATTPTLPATAFNYSTFALPAYLTTPNIAGQINTPANNAITDNGATLGRVLFYDKALSANGTVSCASCHQQAFSFSDPAKFSTGFAGGKTTRNSMSLLNAKYYNNGRFFWDERSATAEAQASRPMVHPVEMGMTMPSVVTKLQSLSYYPGLYQKAYGNTTIDSAKTVRAIAQFIRSMVAYRSKYDTGRGALPANVNVGVTNFSNFTAQENQGKQIYFGAGNCVACHGSDAFTSPTARNNGLNLVYTDNGVGAVNGNAAQNGLFKSPSLRGIEKSAPYMHDGRFATLEQVVEHYSTGVQAHPNLSPPLRLPNGQARRLNLSAADKAALVAFLKTLTDTGIATDLKYASPF